MNIKEKIKSSGVKQWEIAEQIGITEFTLSRWLRRPNNLDPETIKKIENVVARLSSESQK